MSSYEQLAADAVAEIDGAGDLDSLEALRPTLLGKKAPISAAKKDLGSLEPDQRKEEVRQSMPLDKQSKQLLPLATQILPARLALLLWRQNVST